MHAGSRSISGCFRFRDRQLQLETYRVWVCRFAGACVHEGPDFELQGFHVVFVRASRSYNPLPEACIIPAQTCGALRSFRYSSCFLPTV